MTSSSTARSPRLLAPSPPPVRSRPPAPPPPAAAAPAPLPRFGRPPPPQPLAAQVGSDPHGGDPAGPAAARDEDDAGHVPSSVVHPGGARSQAPAPAPA